MKANGRKVYFVEDCIGAGTIPAPVFLWLD